LAGTIKRAGTRFSQHPWIFRCETLTGFAAIIVGAVRESTRASWARFGSLMAFDRIRVGLLEEWIPDFWSLDVAFSGKTMLAFLPESRSSGPPI
jgi:hypothetical protein